MRYITVSEARAYMEARLGYRPPEGAIYRWIREGAVEAIRIRKRVLVNAASLDALVQPITPKKEKGGQV